MLESGEDVTPASFGMFASTPHLGSTPLGCQSGNEEIPDANVPRHPIRPSSTTDLIRMQHAERQPGHRYTVHNGNCQANLLPSTSLQETQDAVQWERGPTAEKNTRTHVLHRATSSTSPPTHGPLFPEREEESAWMAHAAAHENQDRKRVGGCTSPSDIMRQGRGEAEEGDAMSYEKKSSHHTSSVTSSASFFEPEMSSVQLCGLPDLTLTSHQHRHHHYVPSPYLYPPPVVAGVGGVVTDKRKATLAPREVDASGFTLWSTGGRPLCADPGTTHIRRCPAAGEDHETNTVAGRFHQPLLTSLLSTHEQEEEHRSLLLFRHHSSTSVKGEDGRSGTGRRNIAQEDLASPVLVPRVVFNPSSLATAGGGHVRKHFTSSMREAGVRAAPPSSMEATRNRGKNERRPVPARGGTSFRTHSKRKRVPSSFPSFEETSEGKRTRRKKNLKTERHGNDEGGEGKGRGSPSAAMHPVNCLTLEDREEDTEVDEKVEAAPHPNGVRGSTRQRRQTNPPASSPDPMRGMRYAIPLPLPHQEERGQAMGSGRLPSSSLLTSGRGERKAVAARIQDPRLTHPSSSTFGTVQWRFLKPSVLQSSFPASLSSYRRTNTANGVVVPTHRPRTTPHPMEAQKKGGEEQAPRITGTAPRSSLSTWYGIAADRPQEHALAAPRPSTSTTSFPFPNTSSRHHGRRTKTSVAATTAAVPFSGAEEKGVPRGGEERETRTAPHCMPHEAAVSCYVTVERGIHDAVGTFPHGRSKRRVPGGPLTNEDEGDAEDVGVSPAVVSAARVREHASEQQGRHTSDATSTTESEEEGTGVPHKWDRPALLLYPCCTLGSREEVRVDKRIVETPQDAVPSLSCSPLQSSLPRSHRHGPPMTYRALGGGILRPGTATAAIPPVLESSFASLPATTPCAPTLQEQTSEDTAGQPAGPSVLRKDVDDYDPRRESSGAMATSFPQDASLHSSMHFLEKSVGPLLPAPPDVPRPERSDTATTSRDTEVARSSVGMAWERGATPDTKMERKGSDTTRREGSVATPTLVQSPADACTRTTEEEETMAMPPAPIVLPPFLVQAMEQAKRIMTARSDLPGHTPALPPPRHRRSPEVSSSSPSQETSHRREGTSRERASPTDNLTVQEGDGHEEAEIMKIGRKREEKRSPQSVASNAIQKEAPELLYLPEDTTSMTTEDERTAVATLPRTIEELRLTRSLHRTPPHIPTEAEVQFLKEAVNLRGHTVPVSPLPIDHIPAPAGSGMVLPLPTPPPPLPFTAREAAVVWAQCHPHSLMEREQAMQPYRLAKALLPHGRASRSGVTAEEDEAVDELHAEQEKRDQWIIRSMDQFFPEYEEEVAPDEDASKEKVEEEEREGEEERGGDGKEGAEPTTGKSFAKPHGDEKMVGGNDTVEWRGSGMELPTKVPRSPTTPGTHLEHHFPTDAPSLTDPRTPKRSPTALPGGPALSSIGNSPLPVPPLLRQDTMPQDTSVRRSATEYPPLSGGPGSPLLTQQPSSSMAFPSGSKAGRVSMEEREGKLRRMSIVPPRGTKKGMPLSTKPGKPKKRPPLPTHFPAAFLAFLERTATTTLSTAAPPPQRTPSTRPPSAERMAKTITTYTRESLTAASTREGQEGAQRGSSILGMQAGPPRPPAGMAERGASARTRDSIRSDVGEEEGPRLTWRGKRKTLPVAARGCARLSEIGAGFFSSSLQRGAEPGAAEGKGKGGREENRLSIAVHGTHLFPVRHHHAHLDRLRAALTAPESELMHLLKLPGWDTIGNATHARTGSINLALSRPQRRFPTIYSSSPATLLPTGFARDSIRLSLSRPECVGSQMGSVSAVFAGGPREMEYSLRPSTPEEGESAFLFQEYRRSLGSASLRCSSSHRSTSTPARESTLFSHDCSTPAGKERKKSLAKRMKDNRSQKRDDQDHSSEASFQPEKHRLGEISNLFLELLEEAATAGNIPLEERVRIIDIHAAFQEQRLQQEYQKWHSVMDVKPSPFDEQQWATEVRQHKSERNQKWEADLAMEATLQKRLQVNAKRNAKKEKERMREKHDVGTSSLGGSKAREEEVEKQVPVPPRKGTGVPGRASHVGLRKSSEGGTRSHRGSRMLSKNTLQHTKTTKKSSLKTGIPRTRPRTTSSGSILPASAVAHKGVSSSTTTNNVYAKALLERGIPVNPLFPLDAAWEREEARMRQQEELLDYLRHRPCGTTGSGAGMMAISLFGSPHHSLPDWLPSSARKSGAKARRKASEKKEGEGVVPTSLVTSVLQGKSREGVRRGESSGASSKSSSSSSSPRHTPKKSLPVGKGSPAMAITALRGSSSSSSVSYSIRNPTPGSRGALTTEEKERSTTTPRLESRGGSTSVHATKGARHPSEGTTQRRRRSTTGEEKEPRGNIPLVSFPTPTHDREDHGGEGSLPLMSGSHVVPSQVSCTSSKATVTSLSTSRFPRDVEDEEWDGKASKKASIQIKTTTKEGEEGEEDVEGKSGKGGGVADRGKSPLLAPGSSTSLCSPHGKEEEEDGGAKKGKGLPYGGGGREGSQEVSSLRRRTSSVLMTRRISQPSRSDSGTFPGKSRKVMVIDGKGCVISPPLPFASSSASFVAPLIAVPTRYSSGPVKAPVAFSLSSFVPPESPTDLSVEERRGSPQREEENKDPALSSPTRSQEATTHTGTSSRSERESGGGGAGVGSTPGMWSHLHSPSKKDAKRHHSSTRAPLSGKVSPPSGDGLATASSAGGPSLPASQTDGATGGVETSTTGVVVVGPRGALSSPVSAAEGKEEQVVATVVCANTNAPPAKEVEAPSIGSPSSSLLLPFPIVRQTTEEEGSEKEVSLVPAANGDEAQLIAVRGTTLSIPLVAVARGEDTGPSLQHSGLLGMSSPIPHDRSRTTSPAGDPHAGGGGGSFGGSGSVLVPCSPTREFTPLLLGGSFSATQVPPGREKEDIPPCSTIPVPPPPFGGSKRKPPPSTASFATTTTMSTASSTGGEVVVPTGSAATITKRTSTTFGLPPPSLSASDGRGILPPAPSLVGKMTDGVLSKGTTEGLSLTSWSETTRLQKTSTQSLDTSSSPAPPRVATSPPPEGSASPVPFFSPGSLTIACHRGGLGGRRLHHYRLYEKKEQERKKVEEGMERKGKEKESIHRLTTPWAAQDPVRETCRTSWSTGSGSSKAAGAGLSAALMEEESEEMRLLFAYHEVAVREMELLMYENEDED